MSGRPILSRPRTKIYDSNYNIGESYYKSTLDRLDRKYSGRPLSPQRYTPNSALDIADRHARRVFCASKGGKPNLFSVNPQGICWRRPGGLQASRQQQDQREPSVRLQRGSLLWWLNNWWGTSSGKSTPGLTRLKAVVLQTASTLKQIRAAKKVSYVEDADLESVSNNLRTQRLLDRSEKILDSIGINESSASKRVLENEFSYQKRALKACNAFCSSERPWIIGFQTSYDADADKLTKWKAIAPAENGDSAASAASVRARRSRARIDDIDDEMAAMQEKQAVRYWVHAHFLKGKRFPDWTFCFLGSAASPVWSSW